MLITANDYLPVPQISAFSPLLSGSFVFAVYMTDKIRFSGKLHCFEVWRQSSRTVSRFLFMCRLATICRRVFFFNNVECKMVEPTRMCSDQEHCCTKGPRFESQVRLGCQTIRPLLCVVKFSETILYGGVLCHFGEDL